MPHRIAIVTTIYRYLSHAQHMGDRFLVGYPHRSKHFARALHHISSRQEVWLTTGSAIVDWYKQNYLKT